MERAIGEVFDFEGVKLRVEKAGAKISCAGCYFDYPKSPCWKLYGIQKTGVCNPFVRNDKESVIFVKVEDSENKEES